MIDLAEYHTPTYYQAPVSSDEDRSAAGQTKESQEWERRISPPPLSSASQLQSVVRDDISEVPCSWCGQYVPNVKSYELLHLVFLGVFFYFRVDTVINCPGCMRRGLVGRTLLGLVTANLLSPIIIVWNTIQFLRTFI